MASAKRKARRPRPAPPPWLGSWLRSARGKKHQSEIAKVLGWDVSRVCRVELGRLTFDAGELPKVLDAYGLTPRQFELELARAA